MKKPMCYTIIILFIEPLAEIEKNIFLNQDQDITFNC